MRVYKVVRIMGKQKSSAIAFTKETMLEYVIGEKTEPKIEGSPLMAFKTEGEARDWIPVAVNAVLYGNGSTRGNFCILECEAEPHQLSKRRRRPEVVPINWLFKAEDYWKEWVANGMKNIRYQKNKWGTYGMPFGTVLCASITPLRVVK